MDSKTALQSELTTPTETAISAASSSSALSYEAPAIESVLTPDELEREVFYAGNISVSGPIIQPS